LISNFSSSRFWALTAGRGCVEEAAGGETMFVILPPLSFMLFGKRNLPIPGCRIGKLLRGSRPLKITKPEL
jgi:hypothetical protein